MQDSDFKKCCICYSNLTSLAISTPCCQHQLCLYCVWKAEGPTTESVGQQYSMRRKFWGKPMFYITPMGNVEVQLLRHPLLFKCFWCQRRRPSMWLMNFFLCQGWRVGILLDELKTKDSSLKKREWMCIHPSCDYTLENKIGNTTLMMSHINQCPYAKIPCPFHVSCQLNLASLHSHPERQGFTFPIPDTQQYTPLCIARSILEMHLPHCKSLFETCGKCGKVIFRDWYPQHCFLPVYAKHLGCQTFFQDAIHGLTPLRMDTEEMMDTNCDLDMDANSYLEEKREWEDHSSLLISLDTDGTDGTEDKDGKDGKVGKGGKAKRDCIGGKSFEPVDALVDELGREEGNGVTNGSWLVGMSGGTSAV